MEWIFVNLRIMLDFVIIYCLGNIYGIWFYDQDECARLGQLMNRSVVSVVFHLNRLWPLKLSFTYL